MDIEYKPRVARIILASFAAGVLTCWGISGLLSQEPECLEQEPIVINHPGLVDFDHIEEELFAPSGEYATESIALSDGDIIDLTDHEKGAEDTNTSSRFREYSDLMAASMQGNREAQYKLAYAYYEMEEGHSYKTGLNWLRRSARSGYLPAMRDLSLWYCQGIGTDVDPIRSMAWYQLGGRFGVKYTSEFKSMRNCNTSLTEADQRRVKIVYDAQYETVSRNPGW